MVLLTSVRPRKPTEKPKKIPTIFTHRNSPCQGQLKLFVRISWSLRNMCCGKHLRNFSCSGLMLKIVMFHSRLPPVTCSSKPVLLYFNFSSFGGSVSHVEHTSDTDSTLCKPIVHVVESTSKNIPEKKKTFSSFPNWAWLHSLAFGEEGKTTKNKTSKVLWFVSLKFKNPTFKFMSFLQLNSENSDLSHFSKKSQNPVQKKTSSVHFQFISKIFFWGSIKLKNHFLEKNLLNWSWKPNKEPPLLLV